MKQIVPDYYPQFQCIAGACRHSCCIGWEIDIDQDSLQRYQSLEGELGQTLREQIDPSGQTPHFRLGPEERCPFLNEENLCRLILELGEPSLCQICADHPRFRNEFSDRTELGLGLCCEAAAKLILSVPHPVTLTVLADDGCTEQPEEDEEYLFSARSNAIAIAQDRNFSIAERMEHLSLFFDFPLPLDAPSYWADTFLKLERLDESWTDCLNKLRCCQTPLEFSRWETAFEQLLVYFLYRHLPAALYDGDLDSKLQFAILSVQMLQWLCAAHDAATPEELAELARMYSAEIEYSDENLELLWELLSRETSLQ